VIILQIYIDGIFAFKAKRQAPITGDTHGIRPFALAFQHMKFRAGDVHICRLCTLVQTIQYPQYTLREFRRDTAMVAAREKFQ